MIVLRIWGPSNAHTLEAAGGGGVAGKITKILTEGHI